jgi:hypothetical protein
LVMILAIYGIPITLIANFLLIRKHRKFPKRVYVIWLLIISSLLPLIDVALAISAKILAW